MSFMVEKNNFEMNSISSNDVLSQHKSSNTWFNLSSEWTGRFNGEMSQHESSSG